MKAPRTAQPSRRGFTLVEILLVVVILAMIAAFTIPNVLGTQEQASIDGAKIQVKQFENLFKQYRLNNGAYPSTEQGLKALVEKPEGEPEPRKWIMLLEELPLDPWGNDYKYAYPGDHNAEKKPDIWSAGPDSQDGTDDDVGNWEGTEDGGDSSEE